MEKSEYRVYEAEIHHREMMAMKFNSSFVLKILSEDNNDFHFGKKHIIITKFMV